MHHETVKLNKKHSKNSIPNVVKNEIEKLKERKKQVRTLWTILSCLIAACNIIVVILAIFILVKIIDAGETDFQEVGPVAFISVFTIGVFFLSLVLSIFESLKKDSLYKNAINIIQHLVIKFQTNQKPFVYKTKKENKQLLLQIIDAELAEVLAVKKKINKRKILIKALVGDPND